MMKRLYLAFKILLISMLLNSCAYNEELPVPMKWDKQIADMQMKNYGDASWLPPYKEVYMITFFDAKNKPCASGSIEIVTYPEIGRNGLRDDLRAVGGRWSLTVTEYGKNLNLGSHLNYMQNAIKKKS